MRHEARTALLSMALALVPPAMTHGQTQSLSKEEILEQMTTASRSLQSLRAELVQTKSYPQFALTDPSERGTIVLGRSAEGNTLLRVDIAEPEKRTITLTGREYIYYQPSINQAIVGSIGERESAAGGGFARFMVGDVQGVEEDYEIELVGGERIGSRATYHLRMTAREDDGLYKQIDLWVDREIWLPVRQQLEERNLTSTLIELVNLERNVELENHAFEVKLPPGVERVRG